MPARFASVSGQSANANRRNSVKAIWRKANCRKRVWLRSMSACSGCCATITSQVLPGALGLPGTGSSSSLPLRKMTGIATGLVRSSTTSSAPSCGSGVASGSNLKFFSNWNFSVSASKTCKSSVACATVYIEPLLAIVHSWRFCWEIIAVFSSAKPLFSNVLMSKSDTRASRKSISNSSMRGSGKSAGDCRKLCQSRSYRPYGRM